MTRVTGIGGIFFKCNDPEKMKAWYRKFLGIESDEYGFTFKWKTDAEKGSTIWSTFDSKSKYFDPSKKDFMINYRVANLDALIMQLNSEGITMLDEMETYPYGKFIHLLDPEGNKIELWEPIDD